MRRFLIVTFLLGSACSDGGLAPRDLTGEWGARIRVVGSGFGFSLMQAGDSLHGTGGYAIEAGPSGTLTVRGSYTRPDVQLVFTYDSGRRLFFAGQATAFEMVGTVTDSLGSSSPTTYDKR